MTALVAVYIAVWIALQTYVLWLGIRQRQLAARLDELVSQIEQHASAKQASARAA